MSLDASYHKEREYMWFRGGELNGQTSSAFDFKTAVFITFYSASAFNLQTHMTLLCEGQESLSPGKAMMLA